MSNEIVVKITENKISVRVETCGKVFNRELTQSEKGPGVWVGPKTGDALDAFDDAGDDESLGELVNDVMSSSVTLSKWLRLNGAEG